MMKTWKTEHPSYVLKDRWVTIRADRCLTPQGVRVNPCYVMEALDWVHILALDPENNVLLIRQYRHAAGVLSTEIPCGEIEPEESPVEAGKRELREETGCMAERFQFNGSFYPNPAPRLNNRIHSFLAFDARIEGTQDLDETEQIDCMFVTISELLQVIERGEFVRRLKIASVLMGLKRLNILGV